MTGEGGVVARIRGKGHHIFQQWDEGSSKTIVEVRGVSLFFRAKGSVKPVILCLVLDGNI